jgi:hypothetical protein
MRAHREERTCRPTGFLLLFFCSFVWSLVCWPAVGVRACVSKGNERMNALFTPSHSNNRGGSDRPHTHTQTTRSGGKKIAIGPCALALGGARRAAAKFVGCAPGTPAGLRRARLLVRNPIVAEEQLKNCDDNLHAQRVQHSDVRAPVHRPGERGQSVAGWCGEGRWAGVVRREEF